MPLEFRILGPLEAFNEGRALTLGGPKQRALLAALLVRANRVVLDDVLAEEIWPDAVPKAALRSLHVYVHKLRGALGDPDVVERAGSGYRLAVAPGHLDADRFEALTAAGRAALVAGDAAAAASRLESALALWRGAAFVGVADTGAAMDEARRLDELRLEAAEERMEAALALGRAADIVAEIEALAAAHPERERLWGQLMVALYRVGRQSEALAAYHDARRALDEVGIEPGSALRDIEGAILRQDPSLLVEQADLRARRHLPAPRTPLVGRRDALDEIQAIVRGGARLVTLVGPGGVGKTRLALQAAHEVADRFADGVWLVDLSPLRDPGLVATAIAGTIGAMETEGRDARAAALEWVRGRQALLVLDNMEQVDDAAPLLGEMLTAAPGLAILATSRAPLRIYGEHEYRVSPLRLDDEAVPLFVGRAQAARSGFALRWSDQILRHKQVCIAGAEPPPADPALVSSAPAAADSGPCPPTLRVMNAVADLGKAKLRVNCERVQFEGAVPVVVPWMEAFGEVKYDQRSGSLTLIAGAKAKAGAGPASATFKSGLYLTVGAGGIEDVGWRVGPTVSAGGAPVEFRVEHQMNLSFVGTLNTDRQW